MALVPRLGLSRRLAEALFPVALVWVVAPIANLLCTTFLVGDRALVAAATAAVAFVIEDLVFAKDLALWVFVRPAIFPLGTLTCSRRVLRLIALLVVLVFARWLLLPFALAFDFAYAFSFCRSGRTPFAESFAQSFWWALRVPGASLVDFSLPEKCSVAHICHRFLKVLSFVHGQSYFSPCFSLRDH